MRSRAQSLRKNLTKEESKLWYQFLRKYPIQFKRQYQIGNYIVDFYCHKAKLVIELDGSQHCEAKAIEYDNIRTAYLNNLGYHVIRISNLDVNRNFRGVCEYLERMIREMIQEYSK